MQALIDYMAWLTVTQGEGRGKHIGGYFDPAVARQMKALAAEEDTTVQELVAEALDLLFESRGKPGIARQVT